MFQVHEEDVLWGLWRKRCSHEGTRIALSLVQHGMWEKAEHMLGELTNNAAGQQIMVNWRGGVNSMFF